MVKFRWETEFKETEIGKIPKDWNVKRLGELADIKTGKTDVKDAVEDGKYPLFDRSEKVKRSNKYLFDTEAVIVPGEGRDFLPRYYKGKFDLHQRTYAIFNFRNLHGKYLYYAMHILRFYLREMAVGSTVLSLRLPIFQELTIPYPPPEEQQKIATVLSYFDDLIENKKKQNEILEKIALELFKNWFIDFEPFKDEEFIYNEELDKEIPKDWEVKRLGEIAKLIKGVSYKSSEISKEPEENIFITLNNFLRGGGFKTEYIYYKGTKAKETQKIKEGDLIIALTDMTAEAKVVGAPAIVILPNNYEFGIISLDCAKIDVKDEFLKYYLYLYLKYSQKENSTFANGVNVLHLKVELFKSSKFILIPPQPILQNFHSLVQPLFKKIINNQKQIMVLKKIKDALLPKLVFGELRVEEL
ncbi:restriction endonuclease subunit S [Methanocaldococcus sp.]